MPPRLSFATCRAIQTVLRARIRTTPRTSSKLHLRDMRTRGSRTATSWPRAGWTTAPEPTLLILRVPPIQDVTRKLIDTIGPTLVRAIVGLQDSALLEAWSSPGGPTPAPTEQRRVRNAHDQLDRITAVEGADVARAWLIGHNDRLGSTPITALREDRFRDVEAAVSALLET